MAKKLCPRHQEAFDKWADFGPHNPCWKYGLTGKQVHEAIALIRQMCDEGRYCK
jgi:hypothetical protein